MRNAETLYGQPWDIRLDVWHRFHQDFLARAQGKATLPAPPAAVEKRPKKDYYGDDIAQMSIDGRLAIIPVFGGMVKGATGFDKWAFGVCSHEDVQEDIDVALSKGVTSFLFHFNSPGGTVMGTPEFAGRIVDLAKAGKATGAFTSDLCCSAAYYAAAGCQALFCTPSAVVGSIGTIWETVNVAGFLEKLGIEYNVFTSGPLKGTGHPARKLSDEQRAWMQGVVDKMGAEFKGHVTQFRRAVGADSMKGQIFTGAEAAGNGLFDATVSGLSEAIAVMRGF